ncbi:MAG: hypothetical protein M1308_19640 [Actinobacteria bacterium]|nr:hypothetical protein [Actinomycetota bacterium]
MNLRNRFLEVMANFRKDIRPPKWEIGYWGGTVDRWYTEGLPMKNYPKIPKLITTPVTSLYSPAWNSIGGAKLPDGIGVLAGFPNSQSFPTDSDVRDALGLDKAMMVVDVNLLFYPMFEIKTIEEDEDQLTYIDLDGVKRKFMKKTGVIPTTLDAVIKDWNTWEELKRDRINLGDIDKRFPFNWKELLIEYKNRDVPLMLGGYPLGFFGILANLMGYEKLFYAYYDEPKLLHDILKTLTELWLAVYSEVLAQVDVDMFLFWEDMSAGSGSMISPSVMKEFLVPYYKIITGFLKSHNIKIIIVDTDGYCMDIIPHFLEGGLTGIMPVEVSCGMDLLQVRKTFPDLQVLGGIPKLEIKYGEKRIDEILKPVKEMLNYGGYIPTADHFIPPEISWSDFKYYRKKLNDMIDDLEK